MAIHITRLWRGASYFARLPMLGPMYVRYEDWTIRHGCNNLATLYVVAARKGGGAQ